MAVTMPKLNLLGSTRENFAWEARRSNGPFFAEQKTMREPRDRIEKSIFLRDDQKYRELASVKESGAHVVVPLVGKAQAMEAIDPSSTVALRFERPGEFARREA